MKFSCKIATAVRSVAITALESYVEGSGFKAQWSHSFFIEIGSHCIFFS